MKVSVLALAAFAAVAAAGKHRHGHGHMHSKPVSSYAAASSSPAAASYAAAPSAAPAANGSCGCTTVWKTWYGEATLVQPAPASTPAAEQQTYTVVPVPSPATSTLVSVASVPAQTYSAAAAPSAGSNYSTGLPGYAGPGKKWAMVYSPYQGPSSAQSSCKSASQVMQDIAGIAAKGFTAVRIYATDCNQVENVAAACKQYGMKMIIGVFIESAGICQDSYNQLNDIVSYFQGNYELVEMVIIGNEAIFNGYCSSVELAQFILHCKNVLKGAGYTGPVTTSDTVAAFQANRAQLCPVVDVVGANIYSFFNGHVAPADSGNFVAGQIQMLEAACPNKQVYNFECGWPTAGPAFQSSVPSASNQATFIKSIMESDHCGRTVFFTMTNDFWKADGQYTVEPYFGCLDAFD